MAGCTVTALCGPVDEPARPHLLLDLLVALHTGRSIPVRESVFIGIAACMALITLIFQNRFMKIFCFIRTEVGMAVSGHTGAGCAAVRIIFAGVLERGGAPGLQEKKYKRYDNENNSW